MCVFAGDVCANCAEHLLESCQFWTHQQWPNHYEKLSNRSWKVKRIIMDTDTQKWIPSPDVPAHRSSWPTSPWIVENARANDCMSHRGPRRPFYNITVDFLCEANERTKCKVDAGGHRDGWYWMYVFAVLADRLWGACAEAKRVRSRKYLKCMTKLKMYYCR